MTYHDTERPTAGYIGDDDHSEWADIDYAPGGLLGELDAKQDDVLERLNELNRDIERLLRQWQASEALDVDGPATDAA